MREILIDKNVRNRIKFTDPFMHTLEKEEEILYYFASGKYRKPFVIECEDNYLIFNGNHRILVAINNDIEINCYVLENLEDVLKAQEIEGDDYRDVSDIIPLTFEGIIRHLSLRAEMADQNASAYKYA